MLRANSERRWGGCSSASPTCLLGVKQDYAQKSKKGFYTQSVEETQVLGNDLNAFKLQGCSSVAHLIKKKKEKKSEDWIYICSWMGQS